MKKKPRDHLKRLLLLTAVYVMVSFIVLSIVLNAINSTYVLHATAPEVLAAATPEISGAPAAAETPAATDEAPAEVSKYTDFHMMSLPADTTAIAFSSDGQYCAALSGGKIAVVDIKTDKTVRMISESVPVSKFILMHNQNLIIYFLITADARQLVVKTYNITNGKEAVQKTVDISGGAVLKQVDYASSMSLVFFNIETGSAKKPQDTVYYLNANKTLKAMTTTGVIESMTPQNTSMNLSYESNFHVLYSGATPVGILKKNTVTLLGCDKDDNVYVRLNDDRATVLVLNNDRILKTIHLEDLNPFTVFRDKVSVYLVYKSHLINLSRDPSKTLEFDQTLKFLYIADGKIYYSKGNGAYTFMENTI